MLCAKLIARACILSTFFAQNSLSGGSWLLNKTTKQKTKWKARPRSKPKATRSRSRSKSKPQRPNVIILQPDDLAFLDIWMPPPNNPGDALQQPVPFNNGNGLKHIERLRRNGLQMMQAYTGSPMCGTSRFSTITGKMPSRAASVRRDALSEGENTPSNVVIPNTKLEDASGQNDCTEENLAVAFRNGGYKTAMIGKWHLSYISRDSYDHDSATAIVQKCGFDTVEGLYIENFANGEDRPFNSYSDGSFSHNMEWITYEAIKFINETIRADDPFFMYFNPTVPHQSQNVREAILDFDCKSTSDKNYVWPGGRDPWIKGMSEDAGCVAYRQSVIDRAQTYDDLGKIWLDDAVGSLLTVLEDHGILGNTIFLFQEDHGTETKGGLYENGVRIPQFIHYPKEILGGSTFHGLVSTVDIAPTMLDFAGITPGYPMDGRSWREAIKDPSKETNWRTNRCLFFEHQQDRAIRCGCYKYMDLRPPSITTREGRQKGLNYESGGVLFDLCDGTNAYITDNSNNREIDKIFDSEMETTISDALECHVARTDARSNPDFRLCSIFPTTPEPTPSPTPNPTPPPTSQPTPEPTGEPSQVPSFTPTSCEDSPFRIKPKLLSCADVVTTGRCPKRSYWSHCRRACGKCDKCRDAKRNFKLNGKIKVILQGKKKRKKQLNCKTVEEADNRSDLCLKDGIGATCPKTCGFCQ